MKEKNQDEKITFSMPYPLNSTKLLEILEKINSCKTDNNNCSKFDLREDGIYIKGSFCTFKMGEGSSLTQYGEIGRLVHGSIIGCEEGLYLQLCKKIREAAVIDKKPDLVQLLKEFII